MQNIDFFLGHHSSPSNSSFGSKEMERVWPFQNKVGWIIKYYIHLSFQKYFWKFVHKMNTLKDKNFCLFVMFGPNLKS